MITAKPIGTARSGRRKPVELTGKAAGSAHIKLKRAVRDRHRRARLGKTVGQVCRVRAGGPPERLDFDFDRVLLKIYADGWSLGLI